MDVSNPKKPIVDWQRDAPDWSRASCVDVSIETSNRLFFDGGAQGAKLAKDFCVTCPLVELCLAYGQKTHSTGVWGGEELEEGDIIKDGRRVVGRPVSPFCGKHRHLMTLENTRIRKDGSRECISCRRVAERIRTARRKAAREAARVVA